MTEARIAHTKIEITDSPVLSWGAGFFFYPELNQVRFGGCDERIKISPEEKDLLQTLFSDPGEYFQLDSGTAQRILVKLGSPEGLFDFNSEGIKLAGGMRNL